MERRIIERKVEYQDFILTSNYNYETCFLKIKENVFYKEEFLKYSDGYCEFRFTDETKKTHKFKNSSEFDIYNENGIIPSQTIEENTYYNEVIGIRTKKDIENVLYNAELKRINEQRWLANEKLAEYKRRKSEVMASLAMLNNKISEQMVLRNRNTIEKTQMKKMIDEIDKIKDHNLVKNIKIKNGTLEIYTKFLYFVEPESERRFSLGEMKFTIMLNHSKECCEDILIENLTTRRNGYDDDMHAPHVFPGGEACFGNTENQIIGFISEEEYYAAFITLLNFCQTVNIEDAAGKYFESWDEVDEEGNVINEGHNNVLVCEDCGYRSHYEDEFYECEDCGKALCEDCCTEYECIDGINRTLCQCCYAQRESEAECDGCGGVYNREDLYYKEDTDEWFCEDCYAELNEKGEE